MGKLNLISACFVTFPEQLVLLIVSLLIVGLRDVLNIKSKANLFKMLALALAMTIVTVLLKNFIGQGATIIILSIFVGIYVLILGIHWIEAAAGILIAAVIFMVLEYVSLLISFAITGGTLSIMNTDSTLRVLSGLVPRILDAILAIVLYKLPVTIVNLGPVKDFNKGKVGKIFLVCVQQAFFIFVILRVAKFDYPATLSGIFEMAISIILVISYVVMSIVIAVKFMDAVREEKRNRGHALLLIDSLLKKHGNDIMKIREEVKAALDRAARDFERE